MPSSITVNDSQIQIALTGVETTVKDRSAMLKILGTLMQASVARTFRDEGSPAGSWPRLAASTLKRKGYSAGHKLLILSGRLFGSITYVQDGDTLTIGTGIAYARVHQLGSADRSGGSVGAQAKIAGRGVKVGAYDFARIVPFNKVGTVSTRNKSGSFSTKTVRAQGASRKIQVHVGEHTRHQNIWARPFLVFRPEDPARFVSGLDAYLASKLSAAGAR